MALKQLRGATLKVKSFLTETGTAIEAGTVLVYKPTQPTSGGIGDGHNSYAPTVLVTGTPTTGTPALVAGILLHDVVVQVTGVHKNYQTTDEWAGEYAALVTDGTFYTNKYTGSPTAGKPAYLVANGVLSPTQTYTEIPRVGKFDTAPLNGYVKVSIKID